METIYSLLIAWLMSSIALGVGSSTVAIASFITALKDGSVDQSERRLLKVVYFSLRASMIMFALALFWLGVVEPGSIESRLYLWLMWTLLVLNAIFMSYHWVSYRLGPAFQAGTWYTLGFMLTIEAFNLLPLSWTIFGVLYAVDLLVALLATNVWLFYFKQQNAQVKSRYSS